MFDVLHKYYHTYQENADLSQSKRKISSTSGAIPTAVTLLFALI
jgi:hypothetical protein